MLVIYCESMPDCFFHQLFYVIPQQSYEVDTIKYFILYMKKLKQRELK